MHLNNYMENEKKSMSEGDDDNNVVMENEKESTEGDDIIIVEDNKVVVVNKDDDCYCTEADYYYTHGYQTVVWNAGRISNDKTYFNDHHNHQEVILYRENLFGKITKRNQR